MAKTDFSEILSMLGFGNSGNKENIDGTGGGITSGKDSGKAKEEAETAIADLRSKYSGQVRNQYENSVKRLEKERNDALRENWILQQRAEAALPEQMAAAGINGGASETTLANLRAQYQGNRNDIRSGYMENLGELLDEQNKAQAEGADKYDRMWLDYLLSLAKAEQEHEYDLEEAEQKYKYERLLR